MKDENFTNKQYFRILETITKESRQKKKTSMFILIKYLNHLMNSNMDLKRLYSQIKPLFF